MSVRTDYNRAYQNYRRAARKFTKEYGIISDRKRVKRPTAGSIRALEQERERMRTEARKIRTERRYLKEFEESLNRGEVPDVIKYTGKLPDYITDELKERYEKEIRAQMELEQVENLINEGLFYSGNKVSSDFMVHNAAMQLEEIFYDAKQKYSALQIMEKLKALYGENMQTLERQIEKIIYAVYNLHGSGFAKWSTRGAGARWRGVIEQIKAALT